MDQVIEQLIKLNERDVLDIIGILLPIILTIVIIFQNRMYSCRTNELQKQIHNRDRINQFHNDILAIYNTYYDFCDIIFTSGFDNNVKIGNVNLAATWINNLYVMRLTIGRKMDLAKLIFSQSNNTLYSLIEERFQLAIKIIDKYLEYINTGKLLAVSENAWTRITPQYPMNINLKYNYAMLMQDQNLYEDFLKLCQSKELEEIQTLIKAYKEKHSYENYDKYFENYFSLNDV